jgi:BNR repeat-containing family member
MPATLRKVSPGRFVANVTPLLFLFSGVAFTDVRPVAAADEVAGELILFNDNGAWSWFEDERVIYDSSRRSMVLSSVANTNGSGGAARGGDVEVVSFDLANLTAQRFTLCDNLQNDDHNSAALLLLPDGRYLASYSKHSSDNRLRYRISVNPGEIMAWQPEQEFATAGGTTYSNLFYLAKSNTIFNFHRDAGRGLDPNYLRWNLEKPGRFTYGGRLLTGREGNSANRDRPYLRYAGNGVDRIHFLATDHHPRNLRSNSIYHGYVRQETDGFGVYQSDGTRLGELSIRTTSPYRASDFTMLLRGDAVSPANGLTMTRAWTTDLQLDDACPYAVFTARVDDRDVDHRFFYGRFTRDGWSVSELAKAGGFLYSPENDYTGLAALDPHDPGHVFISTNVDPRNDRALAHYEIFEGSSSNGAASWTWRPITYESSVDNIRPIVPIGLDGPAIVLWMRGNYRSFTNYDTRIVGLVEIVPLEPIAAARKTGRQSAAPPARPGG